jgi:hypothetical protein
MKKIKQMFYTVPAALLVLPAAVLAADYPTGPTVPSSSVVHISDSPIYTILKNVLLYLLGIIGILAIVGFVVAGIMYITAAGDEDRVENAKKMLTYSIIGVVVALVGLVIVTALNAVLGATATSTTGY